MASQSEKSESVLRVPVELTRGTHGLSLDIGGSVLKFVYRSKDDLKEAQDENAKIGHLHLASFPRSELKEALEYIKENAAITREGDETVAIYTTGVGCTEFGKLMCEKFNVKLENLTEFDCFVKSFVYLASKLPVRELVEPYIEEATHEPLAYMKEQMEIIGNSQDVTNAKFGATNINLADATGRLTIDPDAPLSDSDPYPCLLAMFGSGFGFMLVNKDGTFSLVDGSNRGGRSFFGIGTLLTGCKNYTELIELASKGNPHNVDIFSDVLFNIEGAAEGDDSLYSKVGKTKHPGLMYCFGKAIGAKISDFTREDMARSWLNFIVLDAVQLLQLQCLVLGVRRVFFCGSFCNSRLVRECITTEFTRRNLFRAILAKVDVIQFDFLKPGPHLGALGAMINEIDKFIGK